MVKITSFGRPTKAKFGGFLLVQACMIVGSRRLVQVVETWLIPIGPIGVINHHKHNQWTRSNFNSTKSRISANIRDQERKKQEKNKREIRERNKKKKEGKARKLGSKLEILIFGRLQGFKGAQVNQGE